MKIGDRVRLLHPLPMIRLAVVTGQIISVETWPFEGYVIVRLDEPGSYQDAIGGTVTLSEVREHKQNLAVLP